MKQCLELLNLCSLNEKECILESLIKDIDRDKSENTPMPGSSNNNPSANELPSATEHFSYEKFISHYSSFVEDSSLLNDLWQELESLDLYRSNSRKPRSLWLDPPTAHKDVSDPITNYPSISKLLKLVNSHVGIPDADLDCCNIICYSSDKKSLRLHADDEPTISHTRPIATFSLGAARTVEFVPKGSSHTNVVRTIEAESNSLYVKNAGCQAILQHRVLPGSSDSPANQVRYSISFRKFRSEPEREDTTRFMSSSPAKGAKLIPASLLVGDSYLARLDSKRLGKGKKTVVNIAKGGNKIPDVLESLHDFHGSTECEDYIIDQIFISVGTNDIRYCRDRGVSHLKGKLLGLVRAAKNLFPRAKIFIQTLLPLPVTFDNHNYVIKNVLDFNDIILHVCAYERIYILNVFRNFLFKGFRNPVYFKASSTDIHPNSRGIGVLARAYINRIHSKYFGPFSPN